MYSDTQNRRPNLLFRPDNLSNVQVSVRYYNFFMLNKMQISSIIAVGEGNEIIELKLYVALTIYGNL